MLEFFTEKALCENAAVGFYRNGAIVFPFHSGFYRNGAIVFPFPRKKKKKEEERRTKWRLSSRSMILRVVYFALCYYIASKLHFGLRVNTVTTDTSLPPFLCIPKIK